MDDIVVIIIVNCYDNFRNNNNIKMLLIVGYVGQFVHFC